MGRLVVLDASVLIAFLDPGDAHHEAAVAELATSREEDLVVPASAYAEILVHPYRRGFEEGARIEQFVADFPIQIEPIDPRIAREAAQLRAKKPKVSLPDALVLATGDILDADVVLTAEREWPKVSKRARVI